MNCSRLFFLIIISYGGSQRTNPLPNYVVVAMRIYKVGNIMRKPWAPSAELSETARYSAYKLRNSVDPTSINVTQTFSRARADVIRVIPTLRLKKIPPGRATTQ